MSEQKKPFEAPVIATTVMTVTNLVGASGGWLTGNHTFELPDLNNPSLDE